MTTNNYHHYHCLKAVALAVRSWVTAQAGSSTSITRLEQPRWRLPLDIDSILVTKGSNGQHLRSRRENYVSSEEGSYIQVLHSVHRLLEPTRMLHARAFILSECLLPSGKTGQADNQRQMQRACSMPNPRLTNASLPDPEIAGVLCTPTST